ncbi:MAG TPA: FkbM family methyltransferase [Chloroflexota bacterium]|nr:FkbM family methyltransferase [Chloroflexota bacterium]
MLGRVARLLGRRSGAGAHPAGPLTPDHVVWAYRLFLDREPENRDVVLEKLASNPNTAVLRGGFMGSPEFQRTNPALAYFSESTVVIKEVGDGLRLFVDLQDYLVAHPVVRGVYEPVETAFVRSRVAPGQTVVDVGANVGYFSVLLAHLVGPAGRVHAFEPLEGNVRLLTASLRENGFAGRVVVHRAAVGAAPGWGDVVVALSHTSAGTYLDAGRGGPPAGHAVQRVPVVSLDGADLPPPVRFVKVDAEGAELLVLHGARGLLRRDRPTLLCEINPPQLALVSGCRPAAFVAEVESYGYRCMALGDGAPHPDDGAPDRPDTRSVVFEPRP